MAQTHPRPLRFRRVLRNALLGVAVACVLVLAAFGAVIGLVLLAVGALVHAIVSAFRAPRVEPGKGRVIEGEYIVVGRAGPSPAAGAGPIRIP
ncbi:MAG TPA: hypothetical protein PLI00_09615 [Pseudomonadota bacterium]|nr:hypothetical protein [Xanthomonadales bacterium]HQY36825.1 hypothetical protein [Pseudomonadota bacterium]HRA37843.1 hypothetical protein [Pseudomonadota bacterium]